MPGASCAGVVYAAAAVTSSEEKAPSCTSKALENTSNTESCKHCHASRKVRPSELPLYGGEEDRAGR